MRIDEIKIYVLGDTIEISTLLLPTKQAILCKDLEEYLEKSAGDSLYTVNFLIDSEFVIPHPLMLQIDNMDLNKDRIIVLPVREATAPPKENVFIEYKRASWEKSPVVDPIELILSCALIAYAPILRHILSSGWVKSKELASEYEIVPYTKEGVYRVDCSIYQPMNEKEELFNFLSILSQDIETIKNNDTEYSKIGIITKKIVEDNISKQNSREIKAPIILRKEKNDSESPDFSSYFRTNSREILAVQRSRSETSNLKELAVPDEIAYNIHRRRPRGFTSK